MEAFQSLFSEASSLSRGLVGGKSVGGCDGFQLVRRTCVRRTCVRRKGQDLPFRKHGAFFS